MSSPSCELTATWSRSAGETLELGAQWSIKKGDVEAFERYMAQLKVYYFDFRYALPVKQP